MSAFFIFKASNKFHRSGGAPTSYIETYDTRYIYIQYNAHNLFSLFATYVIICILNAMVNFHCLLVSLGLTVGFELKKLIPQVRSTAPPQFN